MGEKMVTLSEDPLVGFCVLFVTLAIVVALVAMDIAQISHPLTPPSVSRRWTTTTTGGAPPTTPSTTAPCMIVDETLPCTYESEVASATLAVKWVRHFVIQILNTILT